jgi:hypothetical protein
MSITVEEFETLCRDLKDKRELYELKKREASDVNAQVEAIENKLAECLDESGKDSYKSEFGTVSLSFRTSYRVPQGDGREEFFNYLKSRGDFDGLITVNSQTLNGWAKKEIEAAKERGEVLEIPGLGQPSVTPMVRFSKK